MYFGEKTLVVMIGYFAQQQSSVQMSFSVLAVLKILILSTITSGSKICTSIYIYTLHVYNLFNYICIYNSYVLQLCIYLAQY